MRIYEATKVFRTDIFTEKIRWVRLIFVVQGIFS